MRKWLISLLAIFLFNNLIGQEIKLTQKKSKDDIKVINGDYELYFKRVDVIAAITEIDKVLNTNHLTIVNDVKLKKVKVIDLKSKQTTDKDFINLLKSNLGLYLILKGKVAVYRSARQIQKIVQDQAPNEVDLQGNVTETIFFSEENSDKELFLGSMSRKLHK